MKKKKWRWIFGGVAGLLIVSLIGGWFAFNLLMDKAIDMMFGQPLAKMEHQLDQQLNQQLDLSLSLDPNRQTESEATNPAAQSMPDSSEWDKKTSDLIGEPAPADSKPLSQNGATPAGNISLEQAADVKANFSAADKLAVAAVLLTKLSASELELFTKMASGGISVEEKKEAKKVFLQKLTEQEYNELIAIAAKYGLSQGRNFKETQKDYESP